ncbi:VanZ family protein [Cellvibrio sp. UBA7671]|uniref:VanZ family protein n=1 Tax=Cellvibrio sp. UBA7671 TaxID=1946312 RepID=UPI002F360E6A
MKASLPSWLSGLFILLVVPFFFVGGPDSFSSLLLKNVWNFGHIIFFAVLMLLVQAFKPLAHWRQWFLVTIVAIVIGGAIELVQHFVGRNTSVDDVLHNVFGVWLGLFWGQKPTRRVWLLRFISVMCVLPSLWSVLDAAWGDVVMRQQFPLVNSFESRHEMQQVQAGAARATVRQSDSVVRHGHRSLSVILSTEKYAGISLLGPYGDWSGYQFLTMDFYNPEAERLELVIKISDYQHDSGRNLHGDRFNYPVVLMTGWNHVRIDLNELRSAPAGRDMQMDKITGFTVFALQLPTSREFYWDNIRLQ